MSQKTADKDSKIVEKEELIEKLKTSIAVNQSETEELRGNIDKQNKQIEDLMSEKESQEVQAK